MTFIALETQSSGTLVSPEKAPSRAAAAERSTVERAKLVLYPPPGQAMIKRIPMRRLGRPEDLDGAFLLLAGDASGWMTGATIPVDGGHLVTGL